MAAQNGLYSQPGVSTEDYSLYLWGSSFPRLRQLLMCTHGSLLSWTLRREPGCWGSVRPQLSPLRPPVLNTLGTSSSSDSHSRSSPSSTPETVKAVNRNNSTAHLVYVHSSARTALCCLSLCVLKTIASYILSTPRLIQVVGHTCSIIPRWLETEFSSCSYKMCLLIYLVLNTRNYGAIGV